MAFQGSLTFFESDGKFGSSRIDYWARKWEKISDEYLCWDLVPKSALVKFLLYERLVFQAAYLDDKLLRADFVRAACLGDFVKMSSSSPELLTVEQYGFRV